MKFAPLVLFLFPFAASAHDIWVEASPSMTGVDAPITLSLMLGNHGNQHRDFSLMSKVTEADRMLKVMAPDGKVTDITSTLQNVGDSPTEGFWKASFTPRAQGTFVAYSTFDKVMSYGPVRDIKSAKTFFVAGAPSAIALDKPMGFGLELVPLSDPAKAIEHAGEFKVRVVYKGKSLANTIVNFLPRGVQAEGKFDARYQQRTNANGEASSRLAAGAEYLITAHVEDMESKGEGYESINYAATLFLSVSKP